MREKSRQRGEVSNRHAGTPPLSVKIGAGGRQTQRIRCGFSCDGCVETPDWMVSSTRLEPRLHGLSRLAGVGPVPDGSGRPLRNGEITNHTFCLRQSDRCEDSDRLPARDFIGLPMLDRSGKAWTPRASRRGSARDVRRPPPNGLTRKWHSRVGVRSPSRSLRGTRSHRATR